jgi:hypothetical protein
MNSASGGLRPMVGLRRPRKPFASAGPTPGAQRLERPISIGAEPSADGRPAPTEKHPSCALKDGSSQLNSGRAEANA